MKIICIGRNYVEHIRELNNAVPTAPVFFLKPDTALLIRNRPFYYPPFSANIHHEVELVLKICKAGKNIQPRFAGNYYDRIGIGLDLTARDLQDEAKSKGLP
ncbi:MAG TPA: fumarylacetoacetate hydrolase family protein, partial [Bacteroidales bacterium]|nr:fumarylacetoacetate hydrolase family protein [Bacteroidales bacterium]